VISPEVEKKNLILLTKQLKLFLRIKTMKKPLGIILYKGKSQFDNKPIMVVATGFGKSTNKKTGNVIQTWILRRDIPPIIAIKLGHDYSICGDCKARHFGSCYVNIAHGPHNVYYAFHNDSYVDFKEEHLELFKNRTIRIGSYGDPASVPVSVWKDICSVTDGHMGYTHQWNTRFVDPELKNYCMASCDNEKEYIKAKALGWRTFRIRLSNNDALQGSEFVCPASQEAGVKTSCEKCKACMGTESHTKKDPCIIVHGLDHKIKKFRWGMERIAWKEKYRKVFSYPLKKKKKRGKRQCSRGVKI